MSAERILVFAPHPDDEIIGCGGYLAARQAAKANIRVIVVSDGAAGLLPAQQCQPFLRQQESRHGLSLLQIKDVRFWDYPDGTIPLSGSIISAYRQTVADFRPNLILLPAPGEAHPDHRRVTRGVLSALEGQWAGDLWFYETTQPMPATNTVIDISAHMDNKLQALAAHASQQAQFDYIEHCRSLARMRGIASGRSYGEAFLVFPWDGSAQNFFELRPLLSIIVRANDSQILAHALASLAAQEYDQLEVIVVWFGESQPDLSAFDVLAIRVVAGKPNRGGNLNIGINAARGEYIGFLDQDDVVYPMHLALLLADLQGRAEIDVAHSGCRVVCCRRDGASVTLVSEVEIMNRPVDTGRLLLGNTVPNHALLYRAQIFRTLRFDDTLAAYEDWDFLAQLALAGYRFSHVDEVTCEYRLYSDHECRSLQQAHGEKGYLGAENPVYRRIAGHINDSHLKTLASLVLRLEDAEQDLSKRLDTARQTIAALKTEISEKTAWQDLLKRALPAIGIDKVGKRGLAELIGKSLPETTLFALVVPVHNTPASILNETLAAIVGQSYPGWELCLVDDASTDAGTLAILDDVNRLLAGNGKLRFLRRSERGGIVAASNDALALAGAPYIAFVDHDDVLHEDALLEIALLLHRNSSLKLIYTDSTMIDLAGRLLHVNRKADWSPETLCHLNFINHLTVIRRDLLDGLDSDYEGSQDWDLLFRISEKLTAADIHHLRMPLYAWRATEQSLAYRASAKPEAFAAGMRAVTAHLQRRGLKQVHCRANPNGPGVICDWQAAERSIEIIIPTHNNFDGLKTCVDGILNGTDYPFMTLSIIANRCANQDMLAYLEQLAAQNQINLIIDNRPFNWAALNNAAAGRSHADLLLFMNDDVEIQNRDWLRSMNRYFELDGVGIVGATLHYPNGELQHNGIRTDPAWVADNIQSLGAYGELAVTRNVAAVTGACLLVSRQAFNAVGGFDERFAVNYNDVDFCLAVRHNGCRIVQAADATLVHHESFSRGKPDTAEKKAQLAEEAALLRDKWGDYLFDPHWPEYEVYAQATRILHVD